MNTSPLHPEAWFGLSLHSPCACFHRPCEFTCVTALGSLLFVLWTRQFPFTHSLLLVFTIISPLPQRCLSDWGRSGDRDVTYRNDYSEILFSASWPLVGLCVNFYPLQNGAFISPEHDIVAKESIYKSQNIAISIPINTILTWKLYPSWLAFIVPDGDDAHYQKTEGIVLLSTELYGVEWQWSGWIWPLLQ